MDNLLVILRKPPYGVVNAYEAIRHAGGAPGSGYKSILYLIDSGVYTAKKIRMPVIQAFQDLVRALNCFQTKWRFTQTAIHSKNMLLKRMTLLKA